MGDKLKVGVIGCGGMAGGHVAGYLASGRFEITALADLSPQAMADYDARFGEHEDYHPKHYTDAAAMLDAEGPGRRLDRHVAQGPRQVDHRGGGAAAQGDTLREADGGGPGARGADAHRLRPA